MSRVQSSIPAVDAVAIVSDEAFAQCAGINANMDMAADVTFASRRVVEGYYLHKGYNPVQAVKVVFSSGSLWALYNAE